MLASTFHSPAQSKHWMASPSMIWLRKHTSGHKNLDQDGILGIPQGCLALPLKVDSLQLFWYMAAPGTNDRRPAAGCEGHLAPTTGPNGRHLAPTTGSGRWTRTVGGQGGGGIFRLKSSQNCDFTCLMPNLDFFL